MAERFLAGAHVDNKNPETLLLSMTRFFNFLPKGLKEAFLEDLSEKAS